MLYSGQHSKFYLERLIVVIRKMLNIGSEDWRSVGNIQCIHVERFKSTYNGAFNTCVHLPENRSTSEEHLISYNFKIFTQLSLLPKQFGDMVFYFYLGMSFGCFLQHYLTILCYVSVYREGAQQRL